MNKMLPLLLAAGFVLASCQTVPKDIPTTLSESEYFQLAYQNSDRGNYRGAMAYYDTFLSRFPKDASRDVEADYEIAFLYYKMQDFTKSRDLFTQIVDKYKQKDSDTLPRWPLVLSNKLIIIIDQELAALHPKPVAKADAAEESTPATPSK